MVTGTSNTAWEKVKHELEKARLSHLTTRFTPSGRPQQLTFI
jgi:hypothetical protein